MNKKILDLDIGNSCTKWRMGEQEGTVATGRLPSLSEKIDRVRVSTVAGSESQIKEQIIQTYQVVPEFAKTSKFLLGVSNGYQDYSQLGVDRWLALVSAWHKFQCALLVFDLGTAMTVDYVSKDGTHLGGYIVCGPTAMRATLGQSTRDVCVPSNDTLNFPIDRPARTTEDAVHFGLVNLQQAWIQNCIDVGVAVLECEAKLILTGRDVAHPQIYERFAFHVIPDLVLIGLQLALP